MTTDLNGQILAEGTRVRLFSGRALGTITKLGPSNALVKWDKRERGASSDEAVWPTHCLIALADDPEAS